METNTHTISPLSWEAPAQIEHERTAQWYIAAGVVTIVLIIYALFSGAWSMAIVVALAAAVYFLLRDHPMPTVKMKIDTNGITINDDFAPWEQWESFCILMNKTDALLILDRKSTKKTRDFSVVIQNIDPYAVRDALRLKLPQTDDKRENMFDTLLRITKL